MREALGRIAVEVGEIKVGLTAEIGAIGEEGEGGGVGRPDGFGFHAGVVRRARGGKALAFVESGERSDADFTAVEPGQALAVGRNRDLADNSDQPMAGRGRAGADGGRVLRADGEEGSCAEKERQNSTASTRGREWHGEMLTAGNKGTRERGDEGTRERGSQGTRERDCARVRRLEDGGNPAGSEAKGHDCVSCEGSPQSLSKVGGRGMWSKPLKLKDYVGRKSFADHSGQIG